MKPILGSLLSNQYNGMSRVSTALHRCFVTFHLGFVEGDFMRTESSMASSPPSTGAVRYCNGARDAITYDWWADGWGN